MRIKVQKVQVLRIFVHSSSEQTEMDEVASSFRCSPGIVKELESECIKWVDGQELRAVSLLENIGWKETCLETQA